MSRMTSPSSILRRTPPDSTASAYTTTEQSTKALGRHCADKSIGNAVATMTNETTTSQAMAESEERTRMGRRGARTGGRCCESPRT
ncbi:hypothetical protein OH77DRAFT_1421822 [Trametes cingulata]|nr:hypothetical protein OH77DRAFT_1421822 [Trametes cingulata]